MLKESIIMHAKSAKRGEKRNLSQLQFRNRGGLHCLILNLGKPAIALRTLFRAPTGDRYDRSSQASVSCCSPNRPSTDRPCRIRPGASCRVFIHSEITTPKEKKKKKISFQKGGFVRRTR